MADEAALLRVRQLVVEKSRGKAVAERLQHLSNSMHKWTFNSPEITLPQLKSSLGSMGISSADDDIGQVFMILKGGADQRGSISVSEFCNAMLSQEFQDRLRFPPAPSAGAAGGAGKEIAPQTQTKYPQYVMGTDGQARGPYPHMAPEGAWAPTNLGGSPVSNFHPHPGYKYEGLRRSSDHDVEYRKARQHAEKALTRVYQGKAKSVSDISSNPSELSSAPLDAMQSKPELRAQTRVAAAWMPQEVIEGRKQIQRKSSQEDSKKSEDSNIFAEEELDLSELLLVQFRTALLRRGSGALHVLSQMLRKRCSSSNSSGKAIKTDTMQDVLQQLGIRMSGKDASILCAATARGDSYSPSVPDFLKALYPDISDQREWTIEKVWNRLDPNGAGGVDMDILASRFQAGGHPEVIMGRLRKQDATQEFVEQFNPVVVDGFVARREFFEYYASVSAAINEDRLFEKVMQNSWPSQNVVPAVRQSSRAGSTKNVLVTFQNGSQSVIALEKDLGKDIHNEDTVKRQLQKQGVKGVVECVPTGK